MLLYWSAAKTLESNGVQQLTLRTNQIVDDLQDPHGRPGGPAYGFTFGGNSSGTFAIAVDAEGNNLTRGPDLPTGLPVRDSLVAAVSGGSDVRLSSIGTFPI